MKMKKIYFFLAAAALSFAACTGSGLRQEDPDKDPSVNPGTGVSAGQETKVEPMVMTTYESEYNNGSKVEDKGTQETMAMAPQTTTNTLRVVMTCLNRNFSKEAAAPARAAAIDVPPYVYDGEKDVLTIDFGKGTVIEGMTCSGQAKVFNAQFFLVKNGTVTVQTNNLCVEGMTFIGQFTAKTAELNDGMPSKVDVVIPTFGAFVKNPLGLMISLNGKLSLKYATALEVGGMDLNIISLFGNFNLKTASNLVFTAAQLPVAGELNVKMSKPVSYTYDGTPYEVDNFSIEFAEKLADTKFGFEKNNVGMSKTYAELVANYPGIIDVIGTYLAVIFGK